MTENVLFIALILISALMLVVFLGEDLRQGARRTRNEKYARWTDWESHLLRKRSAGRTEEDRKRAHEEGKYREILAELSGQRETRAQELPPEQEERQKLLKILLRRTKKEAEASGVSFFYQFQNSPEKFPGEELFQNMTIREEISLVTNLLDNAVEAAGQAEDPRRRKVELLLDRRKLQVQNGKRRDLHPGRNEFATTKSDKDAHGFGTKIVREIAERHRILLSCEEEDGWFLIRAEKRREEEQGA